jgi:uncharacterized protein
MPQSVFISTRDPMIIERTYSLLRERCHELFDNLTVDDLRIGLCLTAVRLSDGSCGTAASVQYNESFSRRGNRDFGELTPLKIRGRKVTHILQADRTTYTARSLGIAIISAISSGLIKAPDYSIVEDTDPISLAGLTPGKTVTMVGAFHSYIRTVLESGCKLNLLEINKEEIPEEYREFYVPAAMYGSVIPSADIMIITGQTLVNGTLEDLLGVSRPETRVIVTGPSCNIIPDELFRRGVNITGNLRITDPDLLFEIAGQGGSGYHLFKYCAKKICILNEGTPVE